MHFGVAIAFALVVCAFSARAEGQDGFDYAPDAGLHSEDDGSTADPALDSSGTSSAKEEKSESGPTISGQPEEPPLVAEHITNQPTAPKPDGQTAPLFEAKPPRLEGVVQARYVYQNSSGGPWQGSFETPFVRAGLVGKVGSIVRYEVSGAVSDGRPELFTAFAEVSPLRFLVIKAGQMRVPFSSESMTPEEFLTFPERSLATQEFAYLRDIGISARLHAFQERLELLAGAYNGSGPNRGNDNLDPMFLLRGTIVPLGQHREPAQGDPSKTRDLTLMLGGTATVDYVPAPLAYGYLSGKAVPARSLTDRDINRDGRADDVRVVQLAGDVAIQFRGLAFESEVYQRRENWKSLPFQPKAEPLLVQNKFRGWTAQVSYFVLANRLQVATRASVARISPLTVGSRIRPEVTCTLPDRTSESCNLPYSDVRSELAALVAVHISGLRISGSFTRFRWSSDDPPQPSPAVENQITFLTQWTL